MNIRYSVEYPDVIAWLGLAPGEFTLNDAMRYFLRGPRDTASNAMSLPIIFEDMVKHGELERVGNRRGSYRTVKKELVPIDITQADDSPIRMYLPFGMERLVHIMPGNIITLGGEKNAGKTASLLDMAYHNRNNFDVHCFNSEMGAGEIKLRCRKYSDSNRVSFVEWKKVSFYERSDAFSDVIFPNGLNIIDFYECHDEFYRMGEGIRQIHDKLDKGIAVIAIQKNPGSDDPIGGRRVTEKSRLHCNISYQYGKEYPHRLKISVAKNWANPKNNPMGFFVDYKLANGGYFVIHSFPDPNGGPPKHWQLSKG